MFILKMLNLFLSLTIVLKLCDCARILAIAPFPSYSHQVFFRPMWKKLADSGHHLVLFTTDLMEEHPNIEQIDFHFTYNLRNNKYNIAKVVQENEYNILRILEYYRLMSNEIVDAELRHPKMQDLLKDDSEHFDLLIVEFIHPVLFAFSIRFNCPYITISSMEMANFYHKSLGNPIHPVLYPEVLMPFETNLNFKQRLLSSLYVIYGIYGKYFYSAEEEALARKYFGDDLPPLRAISRNVSVVLINANPVFNIRPLGPGFIRIGGGFHIREKKPLPKEFKEFLDDAAEGVVYFSLGTNVKSSHVSGKLLGAIVEAFRELPYKVLWKFEIDIPEKSDNVKIVKWAPQQDVLRHPNVKLFITQCGMQSLEESIFAKVPMIAIPFVSDQKMNSQRMIHKGLGITLNKHSITKDILKKAIDEVITNTSYKSNVEKVAILMQDEPMTGLEKAIWWTEYVIRHKGVHHFWHTNLDLPTYQFLLLDVITVISLTIVVTIFLLYTILRLILRKLISLRTGDIKSKID